MTVPHPLARESLLEEAADLVPVLVLLVEITVAVLRAQLCALNCGCGEAARLDNPLLVAARIADDEVVLRVATEFCRQDFFLALDSVRSPLSFIAHGGRLPSRVA